MQREFVMMPEFDKQWKIMGLNDNDLKRLQEQLLLEPTAGKVVNGTGGLRKIRFAFKGQGNVVASVLYMWILLFTKLYI